MAGARKRFGDDPVKTGNESQCPCTAGATLLIREDAFHHQVAKRVFSLRG